MSPYKHVIASASVGTILWIFTKSFYAGLSCFAAGIFVDIDHIIEYIVHFGWKGVSVRRVYQACEETTLREGEYQFTKLYLIFHAVEVALVLWIVLAFTKNIYLLAVTVGYSTHLIMDVAKKRSLLSYFIAWRSIKGFDYEKLCR